MTSQPLVQMTTEAAEELGKIKTNEVGSLHDDEASSPNNNVALQRTVSSAAPNYPGPAKLALIMMSLYVSVFLIALDRTIIGVAVPKITNQFHSLDDVGWYGSAYMLTACGFILFFGKIYTFAPTKWTFLGGITLFEIGSAVCGAAPNSISLIIGRAIAGFGSSGIFTGAIKILLASVPMHRRPFFQGLFGACFGVASVLGPILGGLFTASSKLTWRWCFYINLPLGGFTVLTLIFFLHLDEPRSKTPLLQDLKKLDPIGTALFLPAIVCLLLGLQWGGSKYAWSEWRVVVCLVLFGFLILAFIASQIINRNRDPLVPARVFLQRSVLFGGFYQFMLGSSMLGLIVYIPLWFQAIKGVSPVRSGIESIPLVGGVVVGSITAGILVNKIGYYLPFMYIGTVLAAIGSGLLTTLSPTSPSSQWISYQILAGLGFGLGMQQSNLAVQRCLKKRDVSIGISMIFFFQSFGGAIFLSVGQNVFITKFLQGLSQIPGINAAGLVEVGATALRDVVPAASLPDVIAKYSHAVTYGPFLVSAITSSLSIIGCLGTENLSMIIDKKAAADVEAGNASRESKTHDHDSDRKEDPLAEESNVSTEKDLNGSKSWPGSEKL